jgi:hypothetical protein
VPGVRWGRACVVRSPGARASGQPPPIRPRTTSQTLRDVLGGPTWSVGSELGQRVTDSEKNDTDEKTNNDLYTKCVHYTTQTSFHKKSSKLFTSGVSTKMACDTCLLRLTHSNRSEQPHAITYETRTLQCRKARNSLRTVLNKFQGRNKVQRQVTLLPMQRKQSAKNCPELKSKKEMKQYTYLQLRGGHINQSN